MTRLPHVLHLEIDKSGWITWKVDCPYETDRVDDRPGRVCNLVQETTKPYPVQPPGRDGGYTSIDGNMKLVYWDTHEPITGDALREWNEYLQASDEWERWEKIPGCFVQQYIDDGEWDDIICLDVVDPQFPLDVDVHVEGYDEDAYVSKITRWIPKEKSGG